MSDWTGWGNPYADWVSQPASSTIAPPVPQEDGHPDTWVTITPEVSNMTPEEKRATDTAVDAAARAAASATGLYDALILTASHLATATQLETDMNATKATVQTLHDETAADRVQTGADRIATGADRTAVAADRVQADLDRVQTTADRVQTGLDKAATASDKAGTAADRVQTGLDRVATGTDKVATAADRVQTGLDRTATGGDKTATAADRVQTGLDKAATAADRVATGNDKTATAADRVQTGADRTQTGLDRTAAATSATNSATSEANALTYKNAANTSAGNAATSETNALSSKNAANTSAGNAAGSATAAATSATNAATSATNAATSESNALSSKNAAATSAGNAATSETNAANSAAAAAASAGGNIPANTLRGNPTGASAAPTNITLASSLSFNAGAIGVVFGTTAGTVAQGNDTRIVNALQPSGNLAGLASYTTARTNLGLGNAATLNIGTALNTVAAGDDSRLTGAVQKVNNLSDLPSALTARTNLGLGSLAIKSTIVSADITDNTIVNADLAQMAANTLKGNNTGATANAVDMTVAQARTLLALGGAALLNIGTVAGTAAAGDDTRITGAAQKANNLSDLADVNTALATLGGASKRNRVFNPAMQISQENGTTLVTAVSGTRLTVLDAWTLYHSSDAVVKGQQVAVATPSGAKNRFRVTVTTADTAIAVGQFCEIATSIEGYDISDLRFGLASAKQIAVRLGLNFPAGTWPVTIRNGGFTRTWIGTVTISAGEAGTDVVKTLTLTADTTGTWAADNTLGLVLGITLAAGTTYQGAAGWNAGGFFGLSTGTNGLASISNVFNIFDVGLYEGNTVPPFEVPAWDLDLRDCQRYWEKSYDYGTAIATATAIGAFTFAWVSSNRPVVTVPFLVSKRADPTMTIYKEDTGTTGQILNGDSGFAMTANINAVGQGSFSLFPGTISGTPVIGQYLIFHWVANARLM